MNGNNAELWDKLWENITLRELKETIAKEENSIRWQRIQKIILDNYRCFEKLKVIEIGAGIGTCSLLMAKRGAEIHLLDYSVEALAKSRQIFKALNLEAEFIHCDALNLPKSLYGNFDISMSFGLSEHFLGLERTAINRAHFELLREGGTAFISVPNRYNFPYLIWKQILERRGKWPYGVEYPYTRSELSKICYNIGVTDYFFIGDSFFESLKFLSIISPIRIIKKYVPISFATETEKKSGWSHMTKKQKGTFLDQYFGYSLVLCGTKVKNQK